jgi:hypothetical protein|tara:strand:- start:5060 stop:6391 length:1332 start_codon:yes stop_codon:yes gene_type:complete
VLASLGESQGTAEKALSTIEQRVVGEINSSSIRVQLFEGLKQLVVAGNILLYLPPKATALRAFRLDRYVCVRDTMGSVLRIIVHETIAAHVLDSNVRDELKLNQSQASGFDIDNDDQEVQVYTMINRQENGTWEVTQEVEGVSIEASKTTYPKDKSPWLPLRLISVDNEDYGRSYVEEYLGDLKSLEKLTKAIVESSAAAAKLLLFVRPNGTTLKRTVANANNLDVLSGDANDVSTLTIDKQGDFRVTMEVAKEITERLSYAFMLNSAVQRKGERVTAEEIRYMASELENSLGGIYSVLAQELQLPLVTLLMARMQRQRKIPSLPKGMVKPTITSGMEALGRTAELQKLDLFIQSSGAVLGAEEMAKRVNVGEYLKRRAAALQIETEGLLRSEEDIAAEMQQAQAAQLLEKSAPNAINAMAGMAQQAQQAPAEEAPPQEPVQG